MLTFYLLLQYVHNTKESDMNWFKIESDKNGTKWFGKCWFVHNLLKYEFDVRFEVGNDENTYEQLITIDHPSQIPATYPTTAPEIELPELDGLTAKMFRGGKVCLEHFKPLWSRSAGKFGIVHVLALGLAPWLAVEVPNLIEKGLIQYKEKKTLQ
jgi:ufm1-conjugating enzyme 1